MKLSWTSVKISIAGAKLSHLVQEDPIWDHGTMTEGVKNLFYLVEKAKAKMATEPVSSYLTANGREQLTRIINDRIFFQSNIRTAVLTQVAIIEVNKKTPGKPDRFTALLKGKRKAEDDIHHPSTNNKIENFSEKWIFTRQGDWWALDQLK